MRLTIGSLTLAALCIACNGPGETSTDTVMDADDSAHLAHENYVAAINSNNLDTLLAVLTEDVVFMAPNTPVMVGKAAALPWLTGYLEAYKTHWDKPVQEFTVIGDWAFERYAYTSTDTPLAGGDAIVDTGWGLVIYHHDDDGVWRVARDSWGSDQPAQ